MAGDNDIRVIGARENNLKGVTVSIPKGKLVAFAGVSGSGKSSLAFDTIARESSRQWQASYPLFLRNKMPHYSSTRGASSCSEADCVYEGNTSLWWTLPLQTARRQKAGKGTDGLQV